jgi:hypothetical protein
MPTGHNGPKNDSRDCEEKNSIKSPAKNLTIVAQSTIALSQVYKPKYVLNTYYTITLN